MELKLKEKVIIVTGGSKGIGAGIAKELAAAGAKVVVNYVSGETDANAVVNFIRSNGGVAVAIQGDVSKQKDVQQLFRQTINEFGKIDGVVNNAGVYVFNSIEHITEEEFHQQFDINVLGTILTVQESLKYFKDGGHIINIGSMGTRNVDAGTAVYTATKGAVDMLTSVFAKELGSRNIRVNSIIPGLTETEGAHKIGIFKSGLSQKIIDNTSLGRLGQPADIGKVAAFLFSDDAYWITGERISVSGGYLM
ncbi:SDR family NAD(P)-dependent oxidoreductase [Chitinophaga varians]|uniref:SDR family NAD(P)-dependent oxidoreductase n=1 Tax=Chitinophaga varians TaxID=2202339 RepID=UPI00165F6B47|nr:glucose 1-dehydrogenase [Chitinophaga varians]MBC9912412.1 glucose 1-dehydrogenase [Chitinophaga varians]